MPMADRRRAGGRRARGGTGLLRVARWAPGAEGIDRKPTAARSTSAEPAAVEDPGPGRRAAPKAAGSHRPQRPPNPNSRCSAVTPVLGGRAVLAAARLPVDGDTLRVEGYVAETRHAQAAREGS